MPRDYKNSKRKPDRKPVPGWVWLLTGLMIGLLVALLVYLGQQPGSGGKGMVNKKPVVKKKSTVSKKKKTTDKGLRYEFYTILPESEVVIPDQELAMREKQSQGKGKKNHQYLLQAGSFRRSQEAETLKARLALLGVESNIEKVIVNGDTWYRIRIGPFKSARDVNGTRNRLLHNDINAILIRMR